MRVQFPPGLPTGPQMWCCTACQFENGLDVQGQASAPQGWCGVGQHRVTTPIRYAPAASEVLELWRGVPGLENAYEVSNLGRVRSLPRTWVQKSKRGNPHEHRSPGRLLTPGIASNGYPTVVLGRAAGTRCIHAIVAEAFIGPRPDGKEVRHKNGNRRDPRLANLEYGTRAQNIRDALDLGTWWSKARLTYCLRKVNASED